MGARNPEGSNKTVKFYALKAKTDATNSPFFSITEKVDDEWKVTGTFNEMFGVITKAEVLEREFDGQVSKYFRFQLTDDSEVSYVDMTHNGITYNILNSLASDFDTSQEVTIRVYKKEYTNDAGKTFYNGKSYVGIGENSIPWFYEIKDLPKAEQVMKKDGTPLKQNGFNVWDKEEVIKFWDNVFLTKVQPKFVNSTTSNTQPQDSKPDTQPAHTAGDSDVDDLPF